MTPTQRALIDLVGHWVAEAIVYLGLAYGVIILVGCLLGVVFT